MHTFFRTLLCWLLIAFAASASAYTVPDSVQGTSPAQRSMRRVKHFGEDPGRLRMFMHVPRGLAKAVKKPMVVVIHGCTQSAQRIALLSGWNTLADHAGFFVLYVEQRFANDRAHCFNWFKPGDIAPGEGEVASVRSMVDHALKTWPVHHDSVFVYGISSGGGLGAALLACYPEVFQAGAIIAGGAYRGVKDNELGRLALENPKDVSATELGERITSMHPAGMKFPRVIIMHGTDDDVMGIDEADGAARQWAVVHRVDTVPTKIVTDFRGVKGVEQRVYRSADNTNVVTYYRFNGMGHKLPVQPGRAPQRGGKVTKMSPDIGLHSTYVIAQGFGLLQ